MDEHPDRQEERIPEIERLASRLDPPPELKGQVLASLRERGVFLPGSVSPGPWRPWLIGFAAGLFAFFLGLVARPTLDEFLSPPSSAQSYLLLLKTGLDAEIEAPETRARVAEYGAWAGQLRSQEVLVGGEKLSLGGIELGPGGQFERDSKELQVEGYFIVRAPDLAAALDIARTCPHLKYSGVIEVRAIESGAR